MKIDNDLTNMMKITVENKISGLKKKFTLMAEPFPKKGDKIVLNNQFWTVLKTQKTKGFVIHTKEE